MSLLQMEDFSQTKLQILREAVQDNVPRGPHSAVSRPVRRRRRLPFVLGALLLVTILGYLSASDMILRRVASSPTGTPVGPVATASQPAPPAAVGGLAISDAQPRRVDRAVFPLSVRRVVIDAGHGGSQTGTIAQSGVSEKDITLDIALRLRRLMQEASFDALMTRDADQTVGLDQRAEFANSNKADLFVSIHVNSMPRRDMRVLETYYLGPTDDPVVNKLAAQENREAGYGLSEYRLFLEKIYMDTRRDESRRLAKSIHSELHRSVRQFNPTVDDRGVKPAPFAVLIQTKMPAILAEVACLSNDQEVKLLTNDEYKENIAQAILRGVRAYADDLKSSEERLAKNGRKDREE
jgi:N-acetylmuramoyl-L-alanine amidase